jgi:glyoxylase-like metal-dependent hydrolase (beta-lactamase superfamily II)
MEIVEGIHQVDGVNANVYVVVDGKELILIDTGMSGNSGKILNYIGTIGRQASDVTQIVLTHHHMDHVGSAFELKKATNAKIAVHEEDADVVAGKKAAPKFKNILIRAIASVIKVKPVEVDTRLKEGDRVGRLIVVHTPGHTPGSICLHDLQNKVLFVGDALRYSGGKLEGPREQFTPDMSSADQSIQKIAKLDFDIMLSGHGDPLRPDAAKRVREFSASRT